MTQMNLFIKQKQTHRHREETHSCKREWGLGEEWVKSLEFDIDIEVAQSCPTLCNPWTVAHQAPLSMEFSSQEYWSGLPLPSPGDLPDPGIKPRSSAL